MRHEQESSYLESTISSLPEIANNESAFGGISLEIVLSSLESLHLHCIHFSAIKGDS